MTKQQEAIFRRTIPEPNSGCWLWDEKLDRNGYAKFNGTVMHCISYRAFRGEIPPGLTLDHLCRVRCCVNPDHLEAVSHKINILRGISFTAVNARKTHCSHGHPLSGANLNVGPNGRRNCRACWYIRTKAYRARKRSAA